MAYDTIAIGCPACGSDSVAAVETITGYALVSGIDRKGEIDWEGETEVEWNDQAPVTNDAGHRLMHCMSCNAEWFLNLPAYAAENADRFEDEPETYVVLYDPHYVDDTHSGVREEIEVTPEPGEDVEDAFTAMTGLSRGCIIEAKKAWEDANG